MEQLKGDEFKKLLKPRPQNSHKGMFGTAGIVAGSICYQGAASLAVRSALCTGVGITCAFIPDVIYNAVAAKIYGAVLEPLKTTDGAVDDDSLYDRIVSRKCTAVLCGSGLGLTIGSASAVASVSELDIPIVFDGDALTLISKDISLLDRIAPTVITPHIGEFSRLCEKSVEEIKLDKYNLATSFAKKHNCIVVLKDSETVIALPKGKMYALSNPTSALSKGGSGDVLAGILCSFLAQGMDSETASIAAVTLHNTCGHIAAKNHGERASLPEDIIESIRKSVL